MTVLTYAGLPDAVGLELGPSAPILVDQQRVTAFGEATEDRQWLHLDPVAAAEGPFGGTIAHGFLTLSLASAVVFELLHIDGVDSWVNAGLDRVRFPSTVPVGSTVTGLVTLAGVQPEDGFTRITLRVTITADGAAKPACVADLLGRVTPA